MGVPLQCHKCMKTHWTDENLYQQQNFCYARKSLDGGNVHIQTYTVPSETKVKLQFHLQPVALRKVKFILGVENFINLTSIVFIKAEYTQDILFMSQV